jgi:hypothetical protein
MENTCLDCQAGFVIVLFRRSWLQVCLDSFF